MNKSNSPLAVILISRIVYAMNWYNLAPALATIGRVYSVSVAESGLVLSLFLLGAGFFQVVSGIVAARVGSKANCVMGLLLMSATGFIAIFAPNFYVFLALRFLSGVGAAFFFSSGVAVLNENYPERLSTLTGYYVASFDLGAGIVVLAFTPLTVLYGLVGNEVSLGFITLGSAIAFLLVVPRSESYSKVESGVIGQKLRDRRFWFLAVAFSGLWSGNYVFSEYLKEYAHLQGLNEFYSGVLGSSVLFFGFLGSFVSSRLHTSRYLRTGTIMVCFIGVSLIWVPFFGYAGMWVTSFVVGIFTTSVLAIVYTMVVTMEKNRRYVALNSGLFNSIQIMLGFSITTVFALILTYGFTTAWIFMGMLSVATLPFLLPFRKLERRVAIREEAPSGK